MICNPYNMRRNLLQLLARSRHKGCSPRLLDGPRDKTSRVYSAGTKSGAEARAKGANPAVIPTATRASKNSPARGSKSHETWRPCKKPGSSPQGSPTGPTAATRSGTISNRGSSRLPAMPTIPRTSSPALRGVDLHPTHGEPRGVPRNVVFSLRYAKPSGGGKECRQA